MSEKVIVGLEKLSGVCPSCDKKLRFTERFLDQVIRCPSCRSPIRLTATGVVPAPIEVPSRISTVASSDDGREPDDNPAPLAMWFVIATVIAIITWFPLAITVGAVTATFLVGLAELAVGVILFGGRLGSDTEGSGEHTGRGSDPADLNSIDNSGQFPEALDSTRSEISDAEVAALVTQLQAASTAGSSERIRNDSDSMTGLPDTSDERFEPVEIRPAAAPTRQPVFESRKGFSFPKRNRTKDSDVRFCSPGTTIELNGITLPDALVYVVDGDFQGNSDASLIELGLHVARQSAGAERLPYWPQYGFATSTQRKRYLDWLTSGKCDPQIELGYPFIYFYGLERRALVDQKDHRAIVREVLRLLTIYGHSRSFQNYATNFLWAILLKFGREAVSDDATIEKLEQLYGARGEASLMAVLATEFAKQRPLSANVAQLIAKEDDRSPRSVVIQRHQDEFNQLFAHKYAEQFGEGMVLKASKRPKKWRYHPASPTLLSHRYGHDDLVEIDVPNILGLPSQFKPLVTIWTECIAELKNYSREHRKTGGETMTVEMYESLPDALREDDHPELDQWMQLLDKHRDERGHAIVPVRSLAELRGFEARKKLLKRQDEGLARTAELMNLSIEPDPRLTGVRLPWDSHVAIYPSVDTHSPNDLGVDYQAAALLLNLGISIASADGVVDTEEMELITQHLEERFALSASDSKRLEHLAYLLEQHPDQAVKVPKVLKEQAEPARRLVGEYLVAVASADGIVTTEELTALRKLYSQLRLNARALDDLAGVTLDEEESPTASTLSLDPNRIREILAETRKVREMLTDAMSVDEGEDAEGQPKDATDLPVEAVSSRPQAVEAEKQEPRLCADTAAHVSSPNWPGLTARYVGFAEALAMQDEWPHTDVESLAREHKLMPAGAIEALNDWSLDRLGDWIVDDTGDTVVVARALLTAAGQVSS